MYSQTYSDYNRRGDEAMDKKDYFMAKSLYSEGLVDCNFYSIKKLTEIYENQPSMQRGLKITMSHCRNCLVKLAEDKDPSATYLLIDYYNKGLGGEVDSTKAEFWKNEAAAILGLNVIDESKGNKIDSLANPIIPQNSDPVPAPLKFSDKYSFFLAYTFSPTMPLGINVGIFNKFGMMLGFKSSMQKQLNSKYECNNSSIFDINPNTYSYEFTQKEKWESMMFTAQVLFPVVTKKILISAGGGYGKRELYNNAKLYDRKTGMESSSIWCHNTQESYEGAVVEAGAIYKHNHLIIMGGINSVSFKDLDGYIGIGYSF